MNLFRRRKTRPDPLPDPAVAEAVTASGLFDGRWYTERYPDIATFRAGPFVHFCEYGSRERRNPGPNFDTHRYLEQVPAAAASEAPFLHALASGPLSETMPLWLSGDRESFAYLARESGLFDPEWYLGRYPDVGREGADPLHHFTHFGALEWRDPGPGFDAAFYAETYPHWQDLCASPAEHAVRVGRALGYALKGPPAYARWIAAHDALSEADRARICADGAALALPPVALMSLSPVETEPQIGVACAPHPGDGEGLADLPDGATVLLCAGPARLRPHAAAVFAAGLRETGADAAYADHDRIDAAGERHGPVFKPAMSPEFLRNRPYAGPVIGLTLNGRTRPLLAAALTTAAGGGERALADLLLGLEPGRVARLPFILAHVPGEAVEPALPYEPLRESAELSEPAPEGPWPSVRLVIPTRDRVDLLRACLDSIAARTDYPGRLGITVVDNESREPATRAAFAEWQARGHAVVPFPGAFNFARICNAGAAGTDEAILVFLNNDVTVNRPDWLRRLVAHARRPEVGCVGAQLLFPDETVQHGGVVLGVENVGAHRLVGVPAARAAAQDVTREMSAMTGACLAIRREVFEALGGFDPVLAVAFNDTALCLSAAQAGFSNIYVGAPLLHHHESQTRGHDDSRLKKERNHREAIYVRERFPEFFRDDPSYSPNLSLRRLGGLAGPPRVMRPWRRSLPGKPRVLLLSRVHGVGHGVPMVLAQQAAHLRGRGFEVFVGGPTQKNEIAYPGCRRVGLWTPQAAAAFAGTEGIDCVIAHTPPFFSIVRDLGRRPLVYTVDHGEPPPALFPDRVHREDVDWEKRLCAPLATRVIAISRTVAAQQFRADAVVLRNGNAHLAAWSPEMATRRRAVRARLGLDGRFVVLNVCRFGRAERLYKGVDRYAEVAADAPFLHSELAGRAVFALAGRGDAGDVAHVEAAGLRAFANPSDAEMIDLYAAADLFVSLSQWEGYNLGIGQALAMGLPVLASDIEAHREFGVPVSNSVPELCGWIAAQAASWTVEAAARTARIESWDAPLTQLVAMIEADLAAVRACPEFWHRTG